MDHFKDSLTNFQIVLWPSLSLFDEFLNHSPTENNSFNL